MSYSPSRLLRAIKVLYRRHLLMALAPLLVSAAPMPSTHSPWSVTVWQSGDGLPNNNVAGLAQTPDGYLWVATYSSPARFDGLSFEKYSCEELAGDKSQKITALELGRDGGLWMGTLHRTVLRLEGKAVRVFTEGLPDRQIHTMVEDGEGALWIAYQGGSAFRLKDGKAVEFGKDDGLPPSLNWGRNICALTRDVDGQIWFAKGGQVGVFRQGRFETLFNVRPVTTRVAAAASGGVWVCSGDQLLRYEEGKPLKDCGQFGMTEPGEPTALLEDTDGSVWIGTSQNGLFHYDGSGFESVATSGQWITDLEKDRKGSLWVATSSGGLNRVRPRIIELEPVAAGAVRSICEDTAGTIWATTQEGSLLRRIGGEWKTFTVYDGWQGGRATCVMAAPDGSIWIGTRGGVLYRRQNETFSAWRTKDGLLGRQIHALLMSKAGDLWIGQDIPDVVQCLRDGRLETFQMPPDIRYIRAMAEDSAGDIWVGTSKGVLMRISRGQVIDETALGGGRLRSIRSLHATPDGGIWIGYADDGAGWLKDGRLTVFSPKEGFPESSVSQVIADGLGWMWFGGDNGIFKVRQSDLEEFALGRAKQPHFIRYQRSEGLVSVEANWGDTPGAMRSRDGRLWIPMRTAVAVVYPHRMREDLEPPPVLLKRIAIDDRTVASYGGVVPVGAGVDLHDRTATLELAPAHHRLEFEFTELSFGSPENVRFRYRLEGFDDNWVEAGGQRNAIYSRLTWGKYRFNVQACNSDGVWNRQGEAFAFTVKPFVWQAWWFHAIGIVLFASVTAAAVRYVLLRRVHGKLRALQQQTALENERARIARDLHDGLGTRLTELGLMAELGDFSEPARMQQSRSELVENVRSLERDLDTIIWAVNPQNDSLENLVGFICRMAGEFFGRSPVRCRFDISDELPACPLTPELRHNLFMVVREAVSNVVKHSEATLAKLSIMVSEETFHFRLEDDGRGFHLDEATAGERNGLKNMRARVVEQGGVFAVQSVPGKGALVQFSLPLKPAPLPAQTSSMPRAISLLVDLCRLR